MPSKKAVIKMYVTDDEQEKILRKAHETGLSASTFAKRVCLGQPVESRVDSKAVLDLLKVNADMGRLGGLLKMWLSEPDHHAGEARRLLSALEAAREELVRKVKSL